MVNGFFKQAFSRGIILNHTCVYFGCWPVSQHQCWVCSPRVQRDLRVNPNNTRDISQHSFEKIQLTRVNIKGLCGACVRCFWKHEKPLWARCARENHRSWWASNQISNGFAGHTSKSISWRYLSLSLCPGPQSAKEPKKQSLTQQCAGLQRAEGSRGDIKIQAVSEQKGATRRGGSKFGHRHNGAS